MVDGLSTKSAITAECPGSYCFQWKTDAIMHSTADLNSRRIGIQMSLMVEPVHVLASTSSSIAKISNYYFCSYP